MQKETPKAFMNKGFERSCVLELLTRFELVTSSLPRMRATDCAIAARPTQLRYYNPFICSCQQKTKKKIKKFPCFRAAVKNQKPCRSFFRNGRVCFYQPNKPAPLLMRTNSGAKTSETIVMSLMRMLIEGPDVSLNGSPTVSPTTAAL